MISHKEALSIVRSFAARLTPKVERIPTRASAGRVVAAPIRALLSNPREPVAAMDGIAIDHAALSPGPTVLENGQWIRINTGEPVPSGLQTVVRIEDVRWDGAGRAVIEKKVERNQSVRPAGEDFVAGQFLFEAGHLLRPQDAALLLAAGHSEVEVFRKPVVRFIPAGSELVTDPHLLREADSSKVPRSGGAEEQGKGGIVESNSVMVGGLVKKWGGDFASTEPVADDAEVLAAAIRSALPDTDIIVLSAGTSAGTRDLTASVLASLGRILFHGVALHPARPVLLADVGGSPILGLPGYPVAACVASVAFLLPLVAAACGSHIADEAVTALAAEELNAGGNYTYARMCVFECRGALRAWKLSGGSSSLASLAAMDGLAELAPGESIGRGRPVPVRMLGCDPRPTIALAGVSGPAVRQRLDDFRRTFPRWRLLFRECSETESLAMLQEGTAHAAVIPSAAPATAMTRRFSFLQTLDLIVPDALFSERPDAGEVIQALSPKAGGDTSPTKQ